MSTYEAWASEQKIAAEQRMRTFDQLPKAVREIVAYSGEAIDTDRLYFSWWQSGRDTAAIARGLKDFLSSRDPNWRKLGYDRMQKPFNRS